MNRLKKIFDGLEKTIKLICSLLLIGIMLLIAAQVFSRYVMGDALSWSEHGARALFIWMIMLYAGILVRNSGNLGFDLVVKALPAWLGNIFGLFCEASVFLFSAYWLVNSAKLCAGLSKLAFADLKLPYNTIYSAEPVGAAIICIFSIEIIARRIANMHGDRKENKC